MSEYVEVDWHRLLGPRLDPVRSAVATFTERCSWSEADGLAQLAEACRALAAEAEDCARWISTAPPLDEDGEATVEFMRWAQVGGTHGHQA